MKQLLFALFAASVLLFGCAAQQPGTPAAPQGQNATAAKLKVVASFYPMYEFSKAVGGERADVSVLIPPGAEPHNFEPTPSAIKQLSGADIFVLNGAGLEHSWAHGLIEGLDNKGRVVVEASSGVELIAADAHHHDEGHEHESEAHNESAEHEAEAHHDEEGHSHGEFDPHVWLSPVLAKKQVENIKLAFIAADPEGRAYYEANAAAYEAKLGTLDAQYRATFSTCKKKDILITHATLGYFCREYGCRQIPIEGVSHEGEPSPAELASIVDQARVSNVTAVYFESMISPKSAQVLADEIGAQALVFNTVHGVTAEEQARGADYLSLMGDNLKNIKAGLECS